MPPNNTPNTPKGRPIGKGMSKENSIEPSTKVVFFLLGIGLSIIFLSWAYHVGYNQGIIDSHQMESEKEI